VGSEGGGNPLRVDGGSQLGQAFGLQDSQVVVAQQAGSQEAPLEGRNGCGGGPVGRRTVTEAVSNGPSWNGDERRKPETLWQSSVSGLETWLGRLVRVGNPAG
jgi:hypothetical protein